MTIFRRAVEMGSRPTRVCKYTYNNRYNIYAACAHIRLKRQKNSRHHQGDAGCSRNLFCLGVVVRKTVVGQAEHGQIIELRCTADKGLH